MTASPAKAPPLDSIDWASLHHAGGPADDVPDMILALADEDPEVRASAIDALLDEVFEYDEDTGKVSLFDCTAQVIPFLAAFVDREPDESAADGGAALEDDQAMISDVLQHLAAASRDPTHDKALREAVAHALEHHASWTLDVPE